ncbi:MAG: sulfatase-like hydrolase/transferase [Planctomycetota bacterium]|nr:MAG: sulfatase-like hydrolase/transferase [Planctomycetota bacterium]
MELNEKQPLSRWRGMLLGLLLVVFVAAVWFFRASILPSRKPRRVILISIDTCRADYLSGYGFARKTTPNIDVVAKEGIVFKNALAPIPLTLPAHCSMLTGTYPLYHGVHDNLEYALAEFNTTIAEILRTRGYSTAAVVSSFVLDEQFGTGQGFDSYNDKFVQPIGPGDSLERRGEEASRFACSYIDQHQNDPFFLFLHYFDPHNDYIPPEPFASEYADNLYAGEIAYTDYCIAQVIDKLKSLDLYDSSLIIIVGDHGEALGDHGETYHGYYIYQSAVRVPFIIRPPKCRKPKAVDNIVSLVDVVPTILGYLGIEAPAHLQGEDLSDYSADKMPSKEKRYVYCESFDGTYYGCNPLLGLVGDRFKYIETTRPELYDLTQDALEENNLVKKDEKRARFMRKQLHEMISQLISAHSADARIELDDQTRTRLESLGYVGSAVVSTTPDFDPNRPDPKDLIGLHEYSSQIDRLILHEQYDQAKTICDKMLRDWPHMPYTYLQLSRVTFKKREFEQSVLHYSRYLAMVAQPDAQHSEDYFAFYPHKSVFEAHMKLGLAYYHLAQHNKAVEHYTAALLIRPDVPDIHNNLALAYFDLRDFDRAIKHWTEALRLAPHRPDMHDNLAIVLYKQGRIDQAIAHWKEALRLAPEWTEVRNKLNEVLQQKNRSLKK